MDSTYELFKAYTLRLIKERNIPINAIEALSVHLVNQTMRDKKLKINHNLSCGYSHKFEAEFSEYSQIFTRRKKRYRKPSNILAHLE